MESESKFDRWEINDEFERRSLEKEREATKKHEAELKALPDQELERLKEIFDDEERRICEKMRKDEEEKKKKWYQW